MSSYRAKRTPSIHPLLRRSLLLLPLFVGIVQMVYSPAHADLSLTPAASAYISSRLSPQTIDRTYANFIESLRKDTPNHEVRRTYARVIAEDIIRKELASEKRYGVKPDQTTQKLQAIKQQFERLLNTSCAATVSEEEFLVHSLICLQPTEDHRGSLPLTPAPDVSVH